MCIDDISSINYDLQNWSYIATYIIAFFAALGSGWAVSEIILMKKRERDRTIIELMDLIANKDERANRRKIFLYFKNPERSDLKGRELASYIEHIINIANEEESRGITTSLFISLKNAIEETINLYDQVSFVLLKGGRKLREDVPQWIYRNLGEMWKYIGSYVELRLEEDEEWAKYYKEVYSTMPERFRVF